MQLRHVHLPVNGRRFIVSLSVPQLIHHQCGLTVGNTVILRAQTLFVHHLNRIIVLSSPAGHVLVHIINNRVFN